MTRTWHHIFTAHPKSVDETYAQHLWFAAKFSGRLFLASAAALIHAVIPCLFEKTASQMIQKMHTQLTSRD